jgi:hypothetical protein
MADSGSHRSWYKEYSPLYISLVGELLAKASLHMAAREQKEI